jgi:NTP pyrophosphatase (non-canonical NTP hydrolase)
LLIAAKLKDVDVDRNELADKYSQAEKELRKCFLKIQDLEAELCERTQSLKSVRSKYFDERQLNEKLGDELRIVTAVSDIAKREVENQLDRNNLREIQLSSLRSLKESGVIMSSTSDRVDPSIQSGKVSYQSPTVDDELDLAKTMYDNAMIRNSIVSSSGLTSYPQTGLQLPVYGDWRAACGRSRTTNGDETCRAILLSQGFEGKIFEDGILRVEMNAKVEKETACIKFLLTNKSPSIIQSVRLVSATSSRPSPSYEFTVDPIDVYLRPGQSVSVTGNMRVRGPYTDLPKICISYLGNEGIPRNNYISVPVAYVKFFVPLMAEMDKVKKHFM